ncbi:hypothetical protein GWK47_003462 [Chionoecetes opilio]|uniref:Uncharacterized protein n=1 Tax=Chionoecetes opilio TaxID=41210 RepID=A0A8J4YLP9_CHIOP|nr:hypothetical protein GWK47_003462 [Chionoecetes opilio]
MKIIRTPLLYLKEEHCPQGKKSDLIGILVEETQNSQKEPPPFLDARILDGAAVVYLLPLTNVTTFNDYANEVSIPHILKLLESCRRVDVVWDSYIASSIKESTREKRGKGVRRKVGGPTKVPSNWPDFLRDPTNKEELFQFLSDKVGSSDWPDGKGGLHNIRHKCNQQREEISMGGLECYVEVTEAFNNFMNHPYMTVTVNCKQFQLLERFTVIIYNKTSNLDSVNEARRELFSQKNRPMEKIPPTQEALLQHNTARSLPSWNLGNQ